MLLFLLQNLLVGRHWKVEVADGLQQLLHRLYHVAVDDGPLGEQLHTREAVEVDDSRLFV